VKYIDPHVHMFSRTTDDYRRMADAGIVAVVEPSFWLGSDRTAPASFWDYFNHLTTVEPARAKGFGIAHYTMIGVNPKEAEDVKLTEDTVAGWDAYVGRDNVVAIGEIGFNNNTANEEASFRLQARYALEHDMLIVIHSPHVEKLTGVVRTVEMLTELGATPEKVLMDHNTEETMDAAAKLEGCYRGLTVYPTKLSTERAAGIAKRWGTDRLIVNSSADWSDSDPLAVVATAGAMRKIGIGETEIEKVVYHNPCGFYGHSGNFRTP